ncbi:MAG: alpha/beta fold hydrolase [Gemmatimonadales bacterium]
MRRSLGVLPVLQALALTGAVAQPPAAARPVDIGANRTLWLACAGVGQPLVVLEAGHTESSATWEQVQPRIATFTRVCSYDRAGRGRSDPVQVRPRHGNDVVRELQVLLRVAPEPGPYLLVGHSLGGAFVRLYAASYPSDVAGLVLVDAVHEGEFAAIDELLTPEQRAAGAGMRPPSPEGMDIEGVFAELAGSRRPLSVPVIVVARGRPLAADEMPPAWTADQRRRREELRQALQADLATLSPAGELLVGGRSGHFVHHDQPEIVAEAVRKLVERWRQARGDL